MPIPDNKVLIDCDILINFQNGEKLSLLGELFSGSMIILDAVMGEFTAIGKEPQLFEKTFMSFYQVACIAFPTENDEMMNEFVILNEDFGPGESACMAYARFNDNIIASSNLRDIKTYCETHHITYLATLDILLLALEENLITGTECDEFIGKVIAKGGRLPVKRIREYKGL